MASKSKAVARNMKIAIQQGFPDEPWRYQSNDKYLENIREQASVAKEVLSLKEELFLLKATLQKVVDAWGDGSKFTEMYKGQQIDASDETKAKILSRLIDSVAKLAKIHLDITSGDYVHVEEVKVWVGEFIRIIENRIDGDVFEEIVEEIKKVPQPVSGKRS